MDNGFMDDDTKLGKPLVIAALLALAFVCVSGWDFEDELVRDAIRKDPPTILGYTIQQDSPGLRAQYEINPVPLNLPISDEYLRAENNERRSTMEKR